MLNVGSEGNLFPYTNFSKPLEVALGITEGKQGNQLPKCL